MARLGIIAGGGTLPLKIIQACQRGAKDFFVLALEGQADKNAYDDFPHRWVKIGATNKSISILKKERVSDVVMAGSVRRPRLLEMRPDWRTLKIFMRLGRTAGGDDALLRAVAAELEKDGLNVIGAHEIEPSLITPEGVLTQKQPSADDLADVKTGIAVVKDLGRQDIGQAAVILRGATLGLETATGTDDLLKRCRGKAKGGVLVKACKPQQDKRLDLPVIGLSTVQRASEAGLAGIAVEAGASMILDREALIETADRRGLFVLGFKT